MAAKIATWRGGLTIVSDAAEKPLLWIDGVGGMHDQLGPVQLYEEHAGKSRDNAQSDNSDVAAEELAVFVAEWVLCAAEREGPIAYRNIHPELRAFVYGLVPSVILVSDDDGVDFILS